ncbi:MAG: adenylosuccinate synthetase [Anaerolineae bacterium]
MAFGSWLIEDAVEAGLEWLTGAAVVTGVNDAAHYAKPIFDAQPNAVAIAIMSGSALALGPDGQVETWAARSHDCARSRLWNVTHLRTIDAGAQDAAPLRVVECRGHRMPATILVGAQWGDEGKGRVADWLAAGSDVVARFGGGDNAGHTVYTGSTVYKLHLVPSGILHSRVTCVLGGGMVINPVNLLREMDDLRVLGVEITPERFMISTRAHIISPAHIALDKASEKARGADKIGTTLRGIGPAYMDKTGRSGLRTGQMIDVEAFAEALYAHIKAANTSLTRDGCETIDPQASAEAYVDVAARLRPYLTDTTRYLNTRLRDGARVLCEGA